MEKQIVNGSNSMTKTILKDDLMFHPVHGLCRVSEIAELGDSGECCYILLPVTKSKGNISFTIPKSALENSGFNKLITVSEANAILDYFKSGEDKHIQDNHAWQFARLIREISASKDSAKDVRRRQRVDRAVQGLVSEVAIVLKMRLKEIAARIQRDLGSTSVINPFVLNAFEKIEKE